VRKEIDDLRAQNDGAAVEQSKNETDTEALNRHTEQKRAELQDAMRRLNQSLALVNRRLNTNYRVDDMPTSLDQVSLVLDQLLNHAIGVMLQEALGSQDKLHIVR